MSHEHEPVLLMSTQPVNQAEVVTVLTGLATAPPSQELSDKIGEAHSAGVGLLQIFAAIGEHMGDVADIVNAIQALIDHVKSKPDAAQIKAIKNEAGHKHKAKREA